MKYYFKYILLLLILFILPIPLYVLNRISYLEEESIYDIILFWGQSNMVGNAGQYLSDYNNNLSGEDEIDSRLEKLGVYEFSTNSDIDIDIVSKYTSIMHVDIDIENDTAYEYKHNYSTGEGKLVPINSNTVTLGEKYGVRITDSGISMTNYCAGCGDIYSLQQSKGTNIIPAFAQKYYELTGHKVIAILGAHDAQQIASFLPHDEINPNELSYPGNADYYLYESITSLYSNAIKYAENKNLKIGHKFYVVFQGESDSTSSHKKLSSSKQDYDTLYQELIKKYKDTFKKVHNYLKKDLNLEFGVVIETARELGSYLDGVEIVHTAKVELANENDDIILGSSYAYDHYAPAKEYSTDHQNNMDKALLAMCISDVAKQLVHFNAAALSQIGRESAIEVTNYLKR